MQPFLFFFRLCYAIARFGALLKPRSRTTKHFSQVFI